MTCEALLLWRYWCKPGSPQSEVRAYAALDTAKSLGLSREYLTLLFATPALRTELVSEDKEPIEPRAEEKRVRRRKW